MSTDNTQLGKGMPASWLLGGGRFACALPARSVERGSRPLHPVAQAAGPASLRRPALRLQTGRLDRLDTSRSSSNALNAPMQRQRRPACHRQPSRPQGPAREAFGARPKRLPASGASQARSPQTSHRAPSMGAVWVQHTAGLYQIHSPILGACLRTIAPVAALYPGNWNKSLLRASAASSRPKV